MRSVNQIIAEHFNIAPAVVDDALPIASLHSDPLDMAEVVMEIEDEFSIDLLGDAAEAIWATGTVGDLVGVVNERLGQLAKITELTEIPKAGDIVSVTITGGRAVIVSTEEGVREMLDAVARMPVYRSHKLVRAAPILRWMTEPSKTDPSIDEPNVTLDLGDDNVLVMPVPSNFFARGEPKVGDMFVIYDDGYKSWSPRQAFDNGYTRADGYTRFPAAYLGNEATADPSPSVK